MKKFLGFLIIILVVLATTIWFNLPKLTPYYTQLTKTRVGLNLDLQPKAQKEAEFVGSGKCKKCHEENYHDWKKSMHSKMVQEIKSDPSVVVADFSKLPSDADFTLAEAVYTIGSKFKQRYMIPATINGKEDFRLGNYQWNSQNKNWLCVHICLVLPILHRPKRMEYLQRQMPVMPATKTKLWIHSRKT